MFDAIRVKPRQRGGAQPVGPLCDWEGCDKPGEHKAPKGRKAVGEFHKFCMAHAREYNKNFNYFSEMNDEQVSEEMRRSASTGGRPTWQQSTNGTSQSAKATAAKKTKPREYSDNRFADPLNLFARAARTRGQKPMTERELRLVEMDKRAFETLGIEGRAPSDDIKRQYKDLVKMHHPDANGGDRGSEDRLRNIITAYNHLKSKGFVV